MTPRNPSDLGSLEEIFDYLVENTWADYGSNINVNDAPLRIWIERIKAGDTPERAGREYHPRSKVDPS